MVFYVWYAKKNRSFCFYSEGTVLFFQSSDPWASGFNSIFLYQQLEIAAPLILKTKAPYQQQPANLRHFYRRQ